MVIIVLVVITVCISSANRIIYGTWNVFSYPNKITFDGCRYDVGIIMTLTTDNEKPKYEITRDIDKLTGKRIYSKEKDFIGSGKVVYLYLDGDRYLAFASGGGG